MCSSGLRVLEVDWCVARGFLFRHRWEYPSFLLQLPASMTPQCYVCAQPALLESLQPKCPRSKHPMFEVLGPKHSIPTMASGTLRGRLRCLGQLLLSAPSEIPRHRSRMLRIRIDLTIHVHGVQRRSFGSGCHFPRACSQPITTPSLEARKELGRQYLVATRGI